MHGLEFKCQYHQKFKKTKIGKEKLEENKCLGFAQLSLCSPIKSTQKQYHLQSVLLCLVLETKIYNSTTDKLAKDLGKT
jgi:hypothetical protein